MQSLPFANNFEKIRTKVMISFKDNEHDDDDDDNKDFHLT